MKSKKLSLLAVAASSALFTSAVSANTISVELTPDVMPAGSGYDWSYTASFVNSYLQTNESRIVIFDFAGYIPGFEVTPAGWTFSTVATGPSPLATAAAAAVPSFSDSTDLVNLLWDFTGVSGLVPNGSSLEFGARSMYGDFVQNAYGTRDRGTNGAANSNAASQGPTNVPYATTTQTVPDSGSTALMAGLGLSLLAVASKRLKKRS